MFCQSCQQESEAGKFCTNCGAALGSEESAVTLEQETDSTVQPEASAPIATEQAQAEEPNEFVEQIKDASSNFGDFFLTLVKKPSEAQGFNKVHMVSAIITIAIFSLIISLDSYLVSQSIYSDLISSSPSFLDDFFYPFIKSVIKFGLIASVTFGAAKVALQDVSFSDVLAKYGAYLMPFMLLYIVGTLFSLATLGFPFTLATTVGLSGPVLVIPTLILLEGPIKKFDKVYVILGLILAAQIISSTVNRIGTGSSWL